MTETKDSDQFSSDMNTNFSVENVPGEIKTDSFISILEHAKNIVQSQWVSYMVSELSSLPESPAKRKVFSICHDEAGLRDLLSKETFREFEVLRFEGEGQLWREMVSSISDREIATIILAKNMIDRLPDSEISKLSLSRQEINLFLDISLGVQEAVDAAYINQMEIADTPEGKKTGPNSTLSGYEYLYRDAVPYIEVFEDEFTALVSTLYEFADRVGQETKDGLLPPVYVHLAEYLNHLAFGFGSYEIDVSAIKNIWEKIDYEFIDLVNSGCPIILNPWGFIIEGNHIGIELMATLNLGASSKFYAFSKEYLALANNTLRVLDPDVELVPFIHQYVFTRNGDNLPWSGTAVAGNRHIVFYDNENENFAKNLYLTYYDSFVYGHTSLERFAYVRGINTIAHETGHLAQSLDESMYQKMGAGLPLNKLEETKADCVSILLFLEKLTSTGSDIAPEEFIEQYLIDYIDEMRASRGHETEDAYIVWYDFSSKVILENLFTCGAIAWHGNKIQVVDGLKGLMSLADLGRSILVLYADPGFNEAAIKQFVSDTENRISQNQDVQRFIDKVSRT